MEKRNPSSYLPGLKTDVKKKASRNRRALKLLITPEIALWPRWEILRSQGDTVNVMPAEPEEYDQYDLILGPHCRKCHEDNVPYLWPELEWLRRKVL